MDINLPDDFSVLTQDWSKGKQTSSFNIYLKYVSVVRLNGNIDLSFTNEWITNVENKKDYVPITFYYETMNYEKFLIYCFDSKEFNPSNFNCEFDYVVIGYDHENNNLLIYEYYFQK